MEKRKVFRDIWREVSRGEIKNHHEAKMTALILARKYPEHCDLIVRACKLRVSTKSGLSSVEKIKSDIRNKSAKILFSKYFDLVNELIDECDLVGQYLTIPDNHRNKKKAILRLSIEASSNPEMLSKRLAKLSEMEDGNLSNELKKGSFKEIKKGSFKVKDSRLKLNIEIDQLSELLGSSEKLFSIAPFLNTKV